MIEFIENFHFLRPYYLLLLLVVLIIYIRRVKKYSNTSSWEQICDKKLLPYILIKGSSHSRKLISSSAYLGVLFSVIALSAPTWQKKEIPLMEEQNPVMVLLSMSDNMRNTDMTPSRLDRAKFEVLDLLEDVKSAQVGVVDRKSVV